MGLLRVIPETNPAKCNHIILHCSCRSGKKIYLDIFPYGERTCYQCAFISSITRITTSLQDNNSSDSKSSSIQWIADRYSGNSS